MSANSAAASIGAATLLLIAAIGILQPVATGAQQIAVQNHTNVCFGRPDGNERNVGNCQNFIRCINGVPFNQACTQNQVYDHVSQTCQPNNATMREQCFACPRDVGIVDLPADFQCQQYVRCFRGQPEQRACSDGLLFDPATRQCNFADRVRCGCPTTDRPYAPVFLRERENCGRFNVCMRGNAVPLQCPPGLHFNRTVQQCDEPREPECILLDLTNNSTTVSPPTTNTELPSTWQPGSTVPTPTPQQPPFRCPSNESITFEPHPDNCEQFYICSYGHVTPSTCPNLSLFDVVSRTCVDAAFARCDARLWPQDE